MRRLIVVAVLPAAALAMACRSTVADPPTSTTSLAPASTSTSTASTSTTTTAATTSEQAVLAAYQAYWDTWLAANDPPDPDHPGLARYYTGTSLERARASIAANQARGVVLRLPPNTQYEHDAVVRYVDGDRAIIDDCAVDDGQVLAADGTVVDDSVVTEHLEVMLSWDGSHWRVADVRLVQEWEGVTGCVL